MLRINGCLVASRRHSHAYNLTCNTGGSNLENTLTTSKNYAKCYSFLKCKQCQNKKNLSF